MLRPKICTITFNLAKNYCLGAANCRRIDLANNPLKFFFIRCLDKSTFDYRFILSVDGRNGFRSTTLSIFWTTLVDNFVGHPRFSGRSHHLMHLLSFLLGAFIRLSIILIILRFLRFLIKAIFRFWTMCPPPHFNIKTNKNNYRNL